MNAQSNKLYLSWNNHGLSFKQLLKDIYMKENYSDGTLLCHGKVYPVHQFVLSTCSDYFNEIFKQCMLLNKNHPFIVVKDLSIEQLEALLIYMYKGEVSVAKENLPNLIKAAEAFKIKGLSVPDEISHLPSASSKKDSESFSDTEDELYSPSKDHIRIDDDISFKKEIGSCVEEKNTKVRNEFMLSDDAYANDQNSTGVKLKNFQDSLLTEIKCEPLLHEDTISIIEGSQESLTIVKHEDDVEKYEKMDWGSFYGQENQKLHTSLKSDHLHHEETKKIKMIIDKSCPNPTRNYKNDSPTPTIQHHYLVHNEEKLYKCHLCNFTSAQKNQIDTHTDEFHRRDDRIKPFKCSNCSFRAYKQVQITAHMIGTHSSENSGKCPLCSFRSVRKWIVLQHMKSEHLNNSPKCPLCKFQSSKKGLLLCHFRKNHLKEKELSIKLKSIENDVKFFEHVEEKHKIFC